MTGVLNRVMIAVMLGCVGLTAGLAYGTLFPRRDVVHFLPLIKSNPGGPMHLHLPWNAPAAGLPLYGYILFGLLAGLSAALGFLVPPTSRLASAPG